MVAEEVQYYGSEYFNRKTSSLREGMPRGRSKLNNRGQEDEFGQISKPALGPRTHRLPMHGFLSSLPWPHSLSLLGLCQQMHSGISVKHNYPACHSLFSKVGFDRGSSGAARLLFSYYMPEEPAVDRAVIFDELTSSSRSSCSDVDVPDMHNVPKVETHSLNQLSVGR